MENDILELIYKKYMKPVYLYLFSLCRSRELAEDLTQETFLKALCAVELAEEYILPWLLKVAKNLYIDSWRKERDVLNIDEIILSDNEEEILYQLIQREQNRRLYEAILLLDEREREAVVLYYFAGISQNEISRQMNISNGNVRVILHRAKKRLRKMLEKPEPDGRERVKRYEI